MTHDRRITLYHAAPSRSSGVLALLEELGAPYELHVLDLKQGDNRGAAYLAVNPMGKVPAIRHGGAVVTEQVAIYLYLADLFPEAGLTPGLGDPLRGPYLRWLVFYGTCFEPAVVDRALKREAAPVSTSPYGDFDAVMSAVTGQLATGPHMLGERMTAADVLWGTALAWTTKFKLVPEHPVIMRYIERMQERPAMKRAAQIDAEVAAKASS
jgi:glutathione S-transferase